MLTLVPEPIELYAIANSMPVPEIHQALKAETQRDTDLPQMLVGDLEGRLLYLLAKLIGARTAVEIGTFTGCSALHIAEALPDDGKLITCDINPESTAIAQKYWDQVSWGHKIDLRLGPAQQTVDALDEPIDLVFIDADKSGYIGYWEALVPKVRSGGLLIADNVLWSGKVLDPQADSDKAIVGFNEHVMADDRVEHVLLTVRDGMTIARKR